jgi:DNA-binding MarR family transcriptional regulator
MGADARNCYAGVVDDPVTPWRAALPAQHRALRAIERDMAAAGVVALSWYDVLLELDAAPGRQLRMQDLAARTVLSRTRVSRLVDDLVRAGLVTRQPDPDDGRASLATLTTEGRRARRAAAPVYLAGIQEHFARHLTATERAQVARALTKVVAAHDATG